MWFRPQNYNSISNKTSNDLFMPRIKHWLALPHVVVTKEIFFCISIGALHQHGIQTTPFETVAERHLTIWLRKIFSYNQILYSYMASFTWVICSGHQLDRIQVTIEWMFFQLKIHNSPLNTSIRCQINFAAQRI